MLAVFETVSSSDAFGLCDGGASVQLYSSVSDGYERLLVMTGIVTALLPRVAGQQCSHLLGKGFTVQTPNLSTLPAPAGSKLIPRGAP